MWVWALSVAGAVTVYEIYFNNESQHPAEMFWTDRVPFYFLMTLGFTGVTLALASLSTRLRGWLGVLAASVAGSILFAIAMPGDANWWGRLLVGRNVVILTTLYLVPPYLIAILLRWRTPGHRPV
jgi:hypothetical protein